MTMAKTDTSECRIRYKPSTERDAFMSEIEAFPSGEGIRGINDSINGTTVISFAAVCLLTDDLMENREYKSFQFLRVTLGHG